MVLGSIDSYRISAERHIDAVMPYVKDHRICVQAGGHTGQFPVHLSTFFNLVFTFEPAMPDFHELVQNLYTEGKRNVVALQAMLDCQHGLGAVTNDASGSNHRDWTETMERAVPMLRIDDLALPSCGLIYLDIEGDELVALRGAADTVAKHRPVIATEVRDKFGHTEELEGLMLSWGYRKAGHYMSDWHWTYHADI